MDHVEDQELTRWAEGTLPPEEADRLRRHFEACDDCSARALGIQQALPAEVHPEDLDRSWGVEVAPAAPPVLHGNFRRWALGAGAAACVAAAFFTWWEPGRPPDPRSPALPPEPGASVAAPVRDLSTPSGSGTASARHLLEDGSVLTIRQGSSLQQLATRDRILLRLEEGELEAEVPKVPTTTKTEKGRFVVQTPAGEVSVLGTRFRIRAFTLFAEGAGPVPAAFLAVEEGQVCFSSIAGAVLVGKGREGISVRGLPLQTRGRGDASWKDTFGRFGQEAGSGRTEAALASAAWLLGGAAGEFPGWEALLTEKDPILKRSALLLAGIGSPGEAIPILERELESAGDGALRAAILETVVKIKSQRLRGVE